MSINRVCISGNLTRDPDLRNTQSGTSVLSFGVAVNDRRQNPQTGNWEDHPNFVDCVTFGKRAESLANILRKGMKVAIDGKLRYSSWEKDGQKRSKLEVVADDVDLPPRSQQPQQQAYVQQPAYAAPQPSYQPQTQAPQPACPSPQPQQAPQQQAMPMPAQPAGTGVYDESIPF